MDFKAKGNNVLKGLNDRGTWVSCKSQGAVSFTGQGCMCYRRKKIVAFWKCHTLLLLFEAHWGTARERTSKEGNDDSLNNCLANRISINSYSDVPCSHLSPTNCNMNIRSPGLYWHVRKWLWTQSSLRSKDCPTFHNDVGEQKSLWSSNGLQGWADNKHSLIKLFEKVRLPLGLLWEQQSSWFIAIQCPSFLILM